eukprot:1184304-Prorocentrum_minimum.AAC.2
MRTAICLTLKVSDPMASGMLRRQIVLMAAQRKSPKAPCGFPRQPDVREVYNCVEGGVWAADLPRAGGLAAWASALPLSGQSGRVPEPSASTSGSPSRRPRPRGPRPRGAPRRWDPST